VHIRQEAALHDIEPGDITIKWQRAKDLAGDVILREANVLADDAHGQHTGHAGNRGLNPRSIVVSKAVFDHLTAAHAGQLRVFRRFYAVDNDVLAAELFNGFLSLLGRAFAHRQHSDHRAHAKDDSEHRQYGAEFMQQQTLNPEPYGAEQLGTKQI